MTVSTLESQNRNIPSDKELVIYKIPRNSIYKKGWIDFNKNGVMDVYENPNAVLDDRIEDLLSQMNVEEKRVRWLLYMDTNVYWPMICLLQNGKEIVEGWHGSH